MRHSGELYWKGRFIHISKVLAKEPVALKQVDDHLWRISFSFYPIGVLNELTGKVSPPKTTRGKV